MFLNGLDDKILKIERVKRLIWTSSQLKWQTLENTEKNNPKCYKMLYFLKIIFIFDDSTKTQTKSEQPKKNKTGVLQKFSCL